MKNQVFNPYLPLYEYVPDGEPRVFNGRLYIYGSHDVAGGRQFCLNDYVVWSAPIEELYNWRCEGVSYRKEQDPMNTKHLPLWAPDVVRGTDGRFYMYYCCAFGPNIGVAVCDKPQGPFEFLGYVQYSDDLCEGGFLEEQMPFDPGVLVDDDGKVYLYYGFGAEEQMHLPTRQELEEIGMPQEEINSQLDLMKNVKFSPGAMVVELNGDMLTAVSEPKMVVPSSKYAVGSGFQGHAFYEASSIRKIEDTYYFIYSSELSHELCYATSISPTGGFVYGGTIISNGDIGYQGRTGAVNLLGNNHGSLAQLGDDWYIFYHRQTHGTEYSRQGCAEKIKILPDGRILQAEMTSCGLNAGPLDAEGKYPAAIACHITNKELQTKVDFSAIDKKALTYICEENTETSEKCTSFIANIIDGATIGYKYFDCHGVSLLKLSIRGTANGILSVFTEYPCMNAAGCLVTDISSPDWQSAEIPITLDDGVHAIYFSYSGKGALDFKEFLFMRHTSLM